jgi:hypothetical protein
MFPINKTIKNKDNKYKIILFMNKYVYKEL